ncbi:MAG: hypothetical protein J5798_09095 [Spirochaetaceae bacterium]|nr:hypothetical protein [Spirochaetaceae bacterium]
MKKSILFFLLFCFILVFASCKNDEQEIRDLITNYQNAVNEYDKEKISSFFEDPDDLYFTFLILDSYRAQGLIPQYKIDVLKVETYGTTAEAKLKTRLTFKGDDASTIAAFNLFTPSVFNSTTTLSKDSGKWKIICEEMEQ